MTVTEFSSPLADYFREFVAMKHALGYKYESNLYRLRQLDDLCSEQANDDVCLSKEIAEIWSQQRPNESPQTRQSKIRFFNELAEFLALRGIKAHVLPLKRNSPTPASYVPYIFTHEQIKDFLRTADKRPSHRAHPISNQMYSVLFRVLYCCGLRISEALNLKYNDMNLKTGVLTVRDGKFGRDRLVPITDSLCKVIDDYLSTIKAHQPNNPYIFPTRFSSSPVTSESAYDYFRKVLWDAGIPHSGRGKGGPRLHDFRHTFAVHSLQKWIDDDVDVYAALPALSTYLGHEDLKITEKYLRLTSEVHPDLVRMSESYSDFVIPEVKFCETD
jgi:integrase